ncbi:PPOX class F420-dependent oxidoreductase [Amycolatopsis samaneae]|uniref:PPOX class F420-dependent oxidoreductase n=1 Tax=Amycolatopsis samaneae TaxID=664691 RepID=A0ABW5GJC7_9PSEU
MGIPLDEAVRELVDGRNFATAATVNPDGSPQTSIIWVGRDGDDVLFSATEARLKVRNLRRDPRISLSILDGENPYRYAEIRGTVTIEDDPARSLPTALSHKYLGKPYPEEPPEVVRVIVRVHAEKIVSFP